MKQPRFWYEKHVHFFSHVLKPLGLLYSTTTKLRILFCKPWAAQIPIICVGNLVVGGSGKTPTAIAIAELLIRKGLRVHFLSRGYGRSTFGAFKVDPNLHDVATVGDEPLLLAQIAPTWVSNNRRSSAKLAAQEGAQIIVMDDGFQNPEIHKDLSLLTIDGVSGFGNNLVLPAGPLRENIHSGLARANAVLIIGPDKYGIEKIISNSENKALSLLHGNFKPHDNFKHLQDKKVFGFAGIGQPKKFFQSLKDVGLLLTGTMEFNDHHIYSASEIHYLIDKAKKLEAQLITTSKDLTRINKELASNILEFPIKLEWEDPKAVENLLEICFNKLPN